MIIGLAVVALIAILFWAAATDEKNRQKGKAEQNARLNRELQKEEDKPRFRLAFTTSDGVVRRTKSLRPIVIGHDDHYLGYVASSKQRAKSLTSQSFSRGYFTDSKGVDYPSCNVFSVTLEEVNENSQA